MPDEKKHVLLEEAKKIREMLNRLIAKLENGEATETVRSELDELKEGIIKLFKNFEDINVDEILAKIRQQADEAKKKVVGVLEKLGSSMEDLTRKGQGYFGDFFKTENSAADIRERINSAEFKDQYFEKMKAKGWDPHGISVSLEALRELVNQM